MQVSYRIKSEFNRVLIITLLLVFVLSALLTSRVLIAADISDAVFITAVVVQNDGSNRTNFVVPFSASGQTLVDTGQLQSDTLDGIVQLGSTEYPSMPPSSRIDIQTAIANDGGVFTNETSGAISSAGLDMTLLPVVPAVGDEYYFGAQLEYTILVLAVGQAGVGVWDLVWEYYDSDSWKALAEVEDNSNGFTLASSRTISFARPIDWATTTVTGSTNSSFFIRARVSSFTSVITNPIGSTANYETGQWWTWLSSIDAGGQSNFNLYTGGSDKVTNHQIFTGPAGIITTDASDLEPGLEYRILFNGRVNYTFSATGSETLCIICKAGALDLKVSGPNALTLRVTGSGGSTALTLSGITQETGSNTSIITIDSSTTLLSLTVAGQGIVIGTSRTVVDTSNNWVFSSSGAVDFTEQIKLFTVSLADTFGYDSEGEWDAGVNSNTDAIAGSNPVDYDNIDTVWATGRVSSNDGYWTSSTYDSTFRNLKLGDISGTSYNVFVRFENVGLDQGEVISTANITYDSEDTQAVTGTKITVRAIDADNASVPGNFTDAINATRTTASVVLTLPNFQQYSKHTSGDFTSVIQEIVDRPGWIRGNSIVLLLEDDGSPTNADGEIMSIDQNNFNREGLNITLQVTTATNSALTGDILIADSPGFLTSDTPAGWIADNGCTNGAKLQRFTGHEGRLAMNVFKACEFSSYNFEASEGEVWSAEGFTKANPSDASGLTQMEIDWLDSSLAIIGTSPAVSFNPTDSRAWTALTLDGETAPATTAWIRVAFNVICSGACFKEDWSYDQIMLCECATAPDYPDALNVLPDGGFEGVYANTNVWTSQTLNPTGVDLDSTTITWTSYEPNKSTLLIETSIDNEATYQAATNGGAISGLSVGDDVSSTNLNVRATFSYAGSTTNEDTVNGQFTPILTELIVLVAADGTSNLEYRLSQLPGLTIEDVSAFTHTGLMSYPDQPLDTEVTETPGLADTDTDTGEIEITTGVSGSTAKQVAFTIPASEGSGGEHLGGISCLLTTASTALGWSNNTLLSVFILFIALVLGIGAFTASGNPMIMIIGIALGMGAGVYMDVLGDWILVTFVIISGAMVGISKSV